MTIDDLPILRPSPFDLSVAPELGVLAALDGILATAAYQIVNENPDLHASSLAHRHLPSAQARQAALILSAVLNLRAALYEYHHLAVPDDEYCAPF
jgi:hypothetical protein